MEKEKMEKVENENMTVETAETEENQMVIKLAKPYHFEDQTYTEIDLSGLENLTGRDMVAVSKTLTRQGDVSMIQEMSMDYALIMASKATGQPVEFFYNLPPKECIKVKNRVTNFLYSAE